MFSFLLLLLLLLLSTTALAGLVPPSVQVHNLSHIDKGMAVAPLLAKRSHPKGPPKILPQGVDRQCLIDSSSVLYVDVEIYARDWGADGQCGKGLLDNIRGECNCIVFDWGCDRVHDGDHHGIWVRFYVTAKSFFGTGGVQRAFLIASAAEAKPQNLVCCGYRGDNECIVSAPGHIGHANMTENLLQSIDEGGNDS